MKPSDTLITIHSKLVLDFTHATALYYYIRALDKSGSGWVRVGVKGLQGFFGCSIDQLRYWSHKGRAEGLFQTVEFNGDHLYIKYRTLRIKNDLTGGIFATARVPLSTLASVEALKAVAYESAIASQQIRAEYAIKKAKKGLPSLPVEKPKAGKVGTRRSRKGLGCESVDHDRGSVYLSRGYEAPGASQLTLALNLGKSASTVNKYCARIPHLKVFNRITDEDNRAGHSFTVTPPALPNAGRRAPKKRRYLQRPSYYFTNPNLEVRRSKRAFGAYQIRYKVKPEQPNHAIKLKDGTMKFYKRKRAITNTDMSWVNDLRKSHPSSPRATHADRLSALGLKRAQQMLIVFGERFMDQAWTLDMLEGVLIADIIETLVATIKLLDAEQLQDYLLMLRRAEDGKHPKPPVWSWQPSAPSTTSAQTAVSRH